MDELSIGRTDTNHRGLNCWAPKNAIRVTYRDSCIPRKIYEAKLDPVLGWVISDHAYDVIWELSDGTIIRESELG